MPMGSKVVTTFPLAALAIKLSSPAPDCKPLPLRRRSG